MNRFSFAAERRLSPQIGQVSSGEAGVKMRVLVLMDEATVRLLKAGARPVAAFSHDKNLFQFAHEALRKGHRVFLATIQRLQERAHQEIVSVFPEWQQSDCSIAHEDLKPNIVVSMFLEAMNIRHLYLDAKLVAIIPSVQWIETPNLFTDHQLFDTITAVRYNIDFFITQNDRMKSIIDAFFQHVARAELTDRILVCPMGIVEEELREVGDRIRIRNEMGLSETEIAIINSGGVWRWTDFATFLRAYCQDAYENGPLFKLFIMGFQQLQNQEHTDYIAGVRDILQSNQKFIGTSIMVEEDWLKASQKALKYTSAADIGLNVNNNSIENWQSYRLRFLDYMYFSLPAINTAGDAMADTVGEEALFLVKSGNIESYKQTLRDIRRDPSLVRRKAEGMRCLARKYDSRATYGRVIDRIIAASARAPQDFASLPPCVLDYAEDRARRLLGEEARLAAALGPGKFARWPKVVRRLLQS